MPASPARPSRVVPRPAPARRRGGLSDADRAEWAAYAGAVRPLPGRPVVAAAPLGAAPPPIAPPANAPAPPSAPARPAAPPLRIGDAPGGLDGASWRRLRGGRLSPERTLDLHGRTAQSAFHALHAFLRAAHAEQVRCVEVITGQGSGERGGVIRRELPLWLNLPPLRPLVLAAVHPHPANAGAVRLLLRRAR